jgi:hypothetical protein
MDEGGLRLFVDSTWKGGLGSEGDRIHRTHHKEASL